MLDASVNEFIDSFSPGDDVVFVVSINEQADLGPVRRAPDRSTKLAALTRVYATLKAPMLRLFSQYRKDGLTIINEMEGSGMFVVGGRPEGWRKFVAEQRQILDAERLVLIPNEQLASIA